MFPTIKEIERLAETQRRPLTREPFSAAERAAGSVQPHSYPTPPGWSMQTAQYGGAPAVLTYKDGELSKARVYPNGENLPGSALKRVPSHLSWQGKRRNFRVIGQVRRGVFEALAIITPKEPTLVTNFADTSVNPQGFDTPSSLVNKLPLSKKVPPITALTTVYPEHVIIVWWNRERGTLLKKITLDRI